MWGFYIITASFKLIMVKSFVPAAYVLKNVDWNKWKNHQHAYKFPFHELKVKGGFRLFLSQGNSSLLLLTYKTNQSSGDVGTNEFIRLQITRRCISQVFLCLEKPTLCYTK